MTRKDFNLIAETLKGLDPVLSPDVREVIANRFAKALATTNNGFDCRRFTKACGINTH